MVLEIAIWGAWQIQDLPLHGRCSSSLPWQISRSWAACSASPRCVGIFFSNQFADRNFAAEKFLAFSHLVGGLALLAAAFSDRVLAVLRAASCSTALLLRSDDLGHQLPRVRQPAPTRRTDFGFVRMGGTVGWIVVSLAVHLPARCEGRRPSRRAWIFIVGRRHLVRAGGLQPDPPAHAPAQATPPAWTASPG